MKDNLGNIYEGEGSGSHGEGDIGILEGNMTFGKIDEAATELIITPIIEGSVMSGGVLILCMV